MEIHTYTYVLTYVVTMYTTQELIPHMLYRWHYLHIKVKYQCLATMGSGEIQSVCSGGRYQRKQHSNYVQWTQNYAPPQH